MKIPEAPQPVRRTETAAPAPARTDKEKPRESKFAKTLDKKALEKSKPEKPAKEHQEAPGMMMPQSPLSRVESAHIETAGARAVSQPRVVEGLVQEIQAVVKGGVQEVAIQFDSKVLDGLHVHVRKEGGELTIRFLARTEQSGQTIAANADQLAAALQANGHNVASIRVQAPGRSEDTRRYGEDRGQGGGQGGRGGRGGQGGGSRQG
jgi:hypothetical protein